MSYYKEKIIPLIIIDFLRNYSKLIYLLHTKYIILNKYIIYLYSFEMVAFKQTLHAE